MDELPREATRILTLAKGAQPGAQAGARERVRARVEAAVAPGSSLQAEHDPQAASNFGGGKGLLTTTKIMLVSGALLIGGGTALWRMQHSAISRAPLPSVAETAARARETQQGGMSAPETIANPSARTAILSERPTARARGDANHRSSDEARLTLAAEISLLSRAADALANQNIGQARSAINEHRRRFQHPQLREERDGLSIVVRCLQNDQGAKHHAAAFMRKSPTSVLAGQLVRACDLD